MITSTDRQNEQIKHDNLILSSITNLVQNQINQDSNSTVNLHNSKVYRQPENKNYINVQSQNKKQKTKIMHETIEPIYNDSLRRKSTVPKLPNIGQGRRNISYHSFHFN